MPGLVPGIHVLAAFKKEDVDGRDEPGHDGMEKLSGFSFRLSRQPHVEQPPAFGLQQFFHGT